jgi:hypothetical protein
MTTPCWPGAALAANPFRRLGDEAAQRLAENDLALGRRSRMKSFRGLLRKKGGSENCKDCALVSLITIQ